jgi:peroxiredoxin
MDRSLPRLALLLALVLAVPLAGAGDRPDDVPDKAPCHVCSAHGETHGDEPVRAWSRYEGVVYTFCNEGCKERFDADPAGYLPPVYPLPAPEVTVHGFDGEPVRLADLRGDWVLVDFWATWCAPCIQLMPALGELHATYGDRGFTALGVSIDEDPARAAEFVEKRGIAYPTVHDGSEEPAWAAFGVKAVPTCYLIDPEGNIVERWVGAWAHDDLAAALDTLLAPAGSQ